MNQAINSTDHSSDIVAHIDQLNAYYHEQHTQSFEWRRQQLQALFRCVEENETRILDAMTADLGKPRLEALVTEIYFVKMEIKECIKHLKKWMKPQRRKIPAWLAPAKTSLVPNPLGLVLVIAPWNYPFHLSIAPLTGALAAGNCVVIKPSEMTPTVSQLIADLLPRYLDQKAVLVCEGGVETSQLLLQQKWNHIFFTGSIPVGKIIMQSAAQHLCPVTLELGGKSPCFVDENADLAVAAKRIVWGKFLNAGQTCVAPDYVMIHHKVYEEMLQQLQQAIEQLYLQHITPTDEENQAEAWQGQYAQIVNQRHYDRLMNLLPDAEKIVLGGIGDREARWIHPTLLRDITFDDTVMQDEIFGPLLPCMSVTSSQEALQLVQNHSHPLAAYIFTEDAQLIKKVKRELACGGLVINHVMLHLAATDLPFGGVGTSGMGSYHGKGSFDVFTHYKPVLEKATWFDPPVIYPPYNSFKEKLMAFFLK